MKNLFNFFRNLFNKLTSAGVAVPEYKNIFVAKVLKIEKHPNADRLRLITLYLGDSTISPVVCGAWNFSEGDMVALALPGSFVPKNVHAPDAPGEVLNKAKIRGVESQGMICAAFELGISKEIGDGVVILKEDIKPGSRLEPQMIK